ncbi:MAG TPA: helix-hairpin-helix domain-containing protein [Gemmatimonadota bacterium]|nr:helix-hairpin-helix domain-containing protein [Gemmatimonadota bacterium]
MRSGEEVQDVEAWNRALEELQTAPGIGPSLGRDLLELGVRGLDDLERADPDELYRRHCRRRGCRVDRCVLYAFRCAVYFASNEEHDPELLKWWSWKDRTPGEEA